MPIAPSNESESRPFAHWLEYFPPGWIASSFAGPDPLELAGQIETRAATFAEWLEDSGQWWDTFALQSLSAALFNRYHIPSGPAHSRPRKLVSLLELDWPPHAGELQNCLRAMQQLLGPPLAVFKAARVAAAAGDRPTARELKQAEEFLVASRPRIRLLVEQLRQALQSCREAGCAISRKRDPDLLAASV